MNTISRVFFPPKLPESSEINFKDAIDALKIQRIARIAKAALFAFTSITATVTLVLSEASIIAWPVMLPLMLISLLAGVIFYRFNALDKRYLGGLDDQTRSTLAKNELSRIFLHSKSVKSIEVTQSLKDINRLLDCEIFKSENIEQILLAHSKAKLNQSIAEAAFEQKAPIIIGYQVSWFEQGRYGLPSFEHAVNLKWNGNPVDPIEISYKTTEKTRDGKDIQKVKATEKIENNILKNIENPGETKVTNIEKQIQEATLTN